MHPIGRRSRRQAMQSCAQRMCRVDQQIFLEALLTSDKILINFTLKKFLTPLATKKVSKLVTGGTASYN